ncbi:speckle-type POZ protein [Microplitis demolitor]|uniref:speckle-type POZ protein n=1 Tax=Microplitis demolitor TaxID=69319 RepID=UPI0004CD32C9|nr:speckle-type POZ protein [Microplitis demolitor]
MEVEAYTQCPSHKISFQWKLDGLIGLMEAASFDKCDEKLISPQFSTKSKLKDKWHLELRLQNQFLATNVGWAEIKLQLDDATARKVRAEATFFMLNSKKEKVFVVLKFCRNYELARSWFFVRFFEIKKLLENKDEYLSNNIVTIGVDLVVYDDDQVSSLIENKFKFSKHRIVDDLEELFASKLKSDVVLIVNDKRIKAHKSILIARSPVLAAMFMHNTVENKNSEINIVDLKAEIIEKMIKFIYTDKVENIDDDAEYLLEAADKYQVQMLKELCEKSLSKSVSPENAVRIMILAHRHNAEQLLEFVNDFIVANAKDVIEASDYKSLDKSNFLLLLTLFKKLVAMNHDSIKLFDIKS